MVVPKKSGKLKIYVDFKKLNVVTKKYSYPLPFTNEVLNIVVGHDAYSF
jgi:nucleosome binding factor SPN SPT16 subunit